MKHPHARHPIARHGRLKTPHPVALVAQYLAVALAVVLVSGAAFAGYATWSVSSEVQTVALAGETDGPPPQISAIDGGVNLLLVGSDSRAGQGDAYGETEGNLNDVTMLMHIAQDHSSATVVSFPRDMVVPVPSCPDPAGGSFDAMSAQPINVTLSYGGLPCTVLTVEALTGLSIPFAAEIQFNGVIEMSNAVGGVPVCVVDPIDDEYTGVVLDSGTHVLQGADALGFLRTRHGVGDGSDLGRISSQQVFLSSLVRTMKSSETLGDFGKLYGIARAASSNMVLSQSLASPDTLVSIALALKDIDLDRVTFVAYPGVTGGDGVYAGKVEPLYDDAAVLFSAISADQPVITADPANTGIGAVVDPNAPTTAAPATPATPSPDVAGDTAADGTATTQTPEVAKTPTALPQSITGQTAAEYTCSKGNDD
ncbi:LCP family protein [Herbiconiux ginsengi]|uniref:Transcriptional attenuator, LytR family n=1 Tax=Herbiconiux ginsengi TaxID=381665 RepID=A0A1H3LQP6_9MICO|nr:LCP family protein [Herbiconiux ginsengi]SDY66887.1 transcriptional attenuator, LytR family [Herbiconiux ginsengi]